MQIVRNTYMRDIFLELTSMRSALRVKKELKRFGWTQILIPSKPRPQNYFSLWSYNLYNFFPQIQLTSSHYAFSLKRSNVIRWQVTTQFSKFELSRLLTFHFYWAMWDDRSFSLKIRSFYWMLVDHDIYGPRLWIHWTGWLRLIWPTPILPLSK